MENMTKEIKNAYYACVLSVFGVPQITKKGKIRRHYPSVEESTRYFANENARFVDGKLIVPEPEELQPEMEQMSMEGII